MTGVRGTRGIVRAGTWARREAVFARHTPIRAGWPLLVNLWCLSPEAPDFVHVRISAHPFVQKRDYCSCAVKRHLWDAPATVSTNTILIRKCSMIVRDMQGRRNNGSYRTSLKHRCACAHTIRDTHTHTHTHTQHMWPCRGITLAQPSREARRLV